MKQRILYFSLIVIGFLFASCSKDSIDKPDDPELITPEQHALVGSWLYHSVKAEIDCSNPEAAKGMVSVIEEAEVADQLWIFKSDNKYSSFDISQHDQYADGDYKVMGDTLWLKFNATSEFKMRTFSIEEDDLVMLSDITETVHDALSKLDPDIQVKKASMYLKYRRKTDK